MLVSNVASEILKLANKSVFLDLEASTGIEPVYTDLQSAA